MSLLFVEGFDWISSGTSGTSLSDVLSRVYSDVSIDASDEINTGRLNLGFNFANNANTRFTTPKLQEFGASTVDTVWIGMYVKTPSSFPASLPNLIEVLSGGQIQLNIQLTSSGEFRVERADVFLLGTSTYALATDTLYYIEFKIVIDDSAGEVRVFVQDLTAETAAAEEYTLTSVDTQNNGGDQAGWDRIGIGWFGNGAVIDDIYILNTAGSVNNDRLGNRVVDVLVPNGVGNSTQFNVTGAASNYLAVDESAPADDDTTYIEADGNGEADLYTASNPVNVTDTVDGVMLIAEFKTTGQDARGVRLPVRSGTTTDEGSTITVNAPDYTTRHRVVEENPDTTSPWTVSEVSSMEIGIKRQS